MCCLLFIELLSVLLVVVLIRLASPEEPALCRLACSKLVLTADAEAFGLPSRADHDHIAFASCDDVCVYVFALILTYTTTFTTTSMCNTLRAVHWEPNAVYDMLCTKHCNNTMPLCGWIHNITFLFGVKVDTRWTHRINMWKTMLNR